MSRRGRWLLAILGAAALLALALSMLAWRQLQPEQLTPWLLRQAGQALGLELTVERPGEFAYRPDPRLVLHGLRATLPGTGEQVGSVTRLELALPWSTLRGGPVEVRRLQIDGLDASAPALMRWLATRPEGAPGQPLPRLTGGLAVTDARLAGDGWILEGLNLELPRFIEGQTTQLDASTRVRTSSRLIDIALQSEGRLHGLQPGWLVSLDTLAAQVEIPSEAATHNLSLDTSTDVTWVPGRVELQAPLLTVHSASTDPRTTGTASLEPVRLTASQGEVLLEESRLRVTSGGDGSLLPDTDARVQARWGQELDLQLDGMIEQWPPGWPGLPEPLASTPHALAIRASYRGPPDLDHPLDLSVSRPDARFDGQVVPGELLDWSPVPGGSPLPPLEGRVQAAELELGGVRMQGVDVVFGREHEDPPDGGP